MQSLTARISLLAPRRMMVQALGSLQSVMKAKYSSPIFFTSKSPAPVPTSSSRSSSVRLTMRAPQALAHQSMTLDTHKSELRVRSEQFHVMHGRNGLQTGANTYLAIRLLSVFRTLRMAVMLALIR